MKINRNLVLLNLLLGLFACGCYEVFEQPLVNKSVKLETPLDSLFSDNRSVIFSWEEIDEATSYEIQIGQPRFDTLGTIFIDSIVIPNFYLGNFDSGVYQWRVRAMNKASTTSFSPPRTLFVK